MTTEDDEQTHELMRAFADAWEAELAKGASNIDLYQLQVSYGTDGTPTVRLGSVAADEPASGDGDETVVREIAHQMLAGIHECDGDRHGEVCQKTTAGLLKAFAAGERRVVALVETKRNACVGVNAVAFDVLDRLLTTLGSRRHG